MAGRARERSSGRSGPVDRPTLGGFMFRILALSLSICALLAQDASSLKARIDEYKMGHSHLGEPFDVGPRQKPWRIEGIGKAHFPISTKNPEVQEWFDQGVTLLHSFWDYEAERAF